MWQIFVSSLILSLLFLPFLAWRWRLNLKIAFLSAFIIGALTGFIVSWLVSTSLKMNLAVIILIEIIFILFLASAAILYRFYRDPERVPAENNRVILSPADGKIIYINPLASGQPLISTKGRRSFRLDEIISTDLLPDPAFLIGIDMNLLNVHINRSPIEGKIILQKHIPGQFISLRKPEAEILNERVSTVVDNGRFRIGVVQIASRLVRQIVCYLKEGDTVYLGQRIGMIRLGSQVDIVIPNLDHLAINVQPGTPVLAGVTVIARYE